MKKTSTLLVFLICWVPLLSAQDSDGYFMFTGGGGFGSHGMGMSSLDFISTSDFFFSAGYLGQIKKSPNVPSNYRSGLIVFDFGGGIPRQMTNMFALSFGKVFSSPSPRCRYVLSGGIGLGRFKEPVNFFPVNSGFFDLGSNYTYSYEKTTVVGLLLTPRIEFPLARWFGLSVGALANINIQDSGFALSLAMHLGHLRD